MRVNYKTSLDIDPGEKWPRTDYVPRGAYVAIPFFVPAKGDLVESNSGLELEVVRRTLTYWGDVLVELHLPQGRWASVSEFLSWYKKRNEQPQGDAE